MEDEDKDTLDLFQIPVSVWYKMQELATRLDIDNGGIYDKRMGAINIWASPEDKPNDYTYPIVSRTGHPREFIAAVYTEPSLVILSLKSPSEAKRIKSVKVYADFASSEGKTNRKNELWESRIKKDISITEYRKSLISEAEHSWVKKKITNLKETAELIIETENSNKTEIDKSTEEQIKNLNEEDTAILDVFKKLANATNNELLRLSNPASRATYLHRGNELYDYNMAMLAKYCHLIGGNWYLLEKSNYYSVLILQRSMFEINLHLAYFNLHPEDIDEYNKSKGRNKKFRINTLISKVFENKEDMDKEYRYYKFLCEVDHPSSSPSVLLTGSEQKRDENTNELKVLIQFNPIYNKTGHMNGLLCLLNNNTRMIETEYTILKDIPDLKPNKDLVEMSREISKKLVYDVVWSQKPVREKYAKLKGIKFEDIDKGLIDLKDHISDIEKFIDSL